MTGENSDEDAATGGAVAGDSSGAPGSDAIASSVMLLLLPRQCDVATTEPSLIEPERFSPSVGLPAAVVSDMQQDDDCLLSEASVRPRRRDPERYDHTSDMPAKEQCTV